MCQTPGSVKRCEQWDGLHIMSLVMSINYSHIRRKKQKKNDVKKAASSIIEKRTIVIAEGSRGSAAVPREDSRRRGRK